jgi:predicted permease
VVSYTFWRSRLAEVGDLAAAHLKLGGARFVIVGVAVEGFRGPSFQSRTDVWVPLAALPRVASGPMPEGILQDRGAAWFSIVGRLRHGASVSQAQSDLEAIRGRFEKEAGSAAWGRAITVSDWQEVALRINRESSRKLIGLLFASGALILMIACANTANLLGGRFLARRSEVALRLALGASRKRAALPFAGECLLLGLAAYAASLLVQASALRLLLNLGFPLTKLDVRLTSTSALLGIGVAALATGLFSGWPLLKIARQDLNAVVKGAGFLPTGHWRLASGRALVALEAALSMALVVAALLAVFSARNLLAVDPGFDSESVAVAAVDLAAKGFSPDQADTFYAEVLDRVRREPGVVTASLTSFLPFEGSLRWTVYAPGTAAEPAPPQFGLDIVDLESFRTLGIRLIRGRDFHREDASDGSVIVNEAMALKLWPGENPLGKSVSLEGPGGKVLQVVGVVADARYAGLDRPPEPHFYLYRRSQDGAGLTTAFSTSLFLLVRTQDAPRSTLSRIREVVRSIDPDLPVPRLAALGDLVDERTARSRYSALLLGLLAGTGLLLAGVGVYGVMISSLLARQRELAVRMVLGASPGSIVSMTLKEAALMLAAGIFLGGALAWGLSRLGEANLYGVAARDPISFLLAGVILFAAGTAGSLFPALRAARKDVAAVLRAA